MATTTNYGWETPDDTDLVKDGASASRTLGSSIDTTLKNLNPETTLGDIAYRSSTANVKTRLALGTAGQVLAVNSGATAPEWVNASAGMTLISTTTLTGASVTLSSIPATYNHLQLVVRNFLPSVDAAEMQIRINADSGANRHDSTSANATNKTFGSTAVSITPGQDNAVTNGLAITTIFDYTNTTTWRIWESQAITNNGTTTTNANLYSRVTGIYNQTGAISSLLLQPTSGNFTSGTVLLYGVK